MSLIFIGLATITVVVVGAVMYYYKSNEQEEPLPDSRQKLLRAIEKARRAIDRAISNAKQETAELSDLTELRATLVGAQQSLTVQLGKLKTKGREEIDVLRNELQSLAGRSEALLDEVVQSASTLLSDIEHDLSE
jgi:Mg2+ and Co2+ transporter CorA